MTAEQAVLATLVIAILALTGGEAASTEGTARRAQGGSRVETPSPPTLSPPTLSPPPRPPGLSGASGVGSAQPRPAPPTPQIQSDGACLAALRSIYGEGIGALSASKPLPTDPQCRIVDPVVVEAVDLEGASIGFSPPVTLSCAMAGKVALWLRTSVRPLTRGYFGRELVKLQVGGGQECRRRNRAATGPVSEHATGRALDIFGFEVAPPDGLRVVVEKPDASIQRDYLLALRQSACGAFSTSLGPGADPAHANHIHVDIQLRRSDASKFCQ